MLVNQPTIFAMLRYNLSLVTTTVTMYSVLAYKEIHNAQQKSDKSS